MALLFVVVAVGSSPVRAEVPNVPLPLKRVVLFTSGVGFFERQAPVEGPATAELQFRASEINDLLKSLIVIDPDPQGTASVTYASKDPLARTLASFRIDLSEPPTLAALLGQLRGHEVVLRAPGEVQGTVISTETHERRHGEELTAEEFVNVLTDAGLKRIAIDDIESFTIAGKELRNELRQALEALATANATDKKSVRISFPGDSARTVRVGYVRETPLWKTSYRLALDDDRRALLQGWAIVENTGDEDWQGVQLQLVSGRPVSFVMNLYDPLYLKRPVVEPELFAQLRPPTYSRGVSESAAEAELSQRERKAGRRAASDEAAAPQAPQLGQSVAGGAAGLAYSQALEQQAATAEGQEVGELFRYDIVQPVTLPRQQSAMLPIVNASVEVEKLSIYDPSVHATHPLNGLRLRNTTGLHLMQGAVTVFDADSYAGDAQTRDLPPGEERLLSYAVDLDTEVSVEPQQSPETVNRLRIVHGVVEAELKLRRESRYRVTTAPEESKRVLIVRPREAGWKLIEPAEPDERAADQDRFLIEVEGEEPAELVVREEYPISRRLQLANLDDGTIRMFVEAREVNDEARQALRDVLGRKGQIAALIAQKGQIEAELSRIGEEQKRLRDNMQAVGRTGTLYNRYLQKLAAQEDRIESLGEKLAALEGEIVRRQQALDEFLATLTIEP